MLTNISSHCFQCVSSSTVWVEFRAVISVVLQKDVFRDDRENWLPWPMPFPSWDRLYLRPTYPTIRFLHSLSFESIDLLMLLKCFYTISWFMDLLFIQLFKCYTICGFTKNISILTGLFKLFSFWIQFTRKSGKI